MTDWTGISLDELYETHESDLRRFAVNLARDEDWADDLLAETMLRSMAHLPSLSGMNPFQRKAWLFQVLKNIFLDQVRRRHREQELLAQLGRAVAQSTHPALDERLTKPIPPHHRAILQLRYDEGLTGEEIGQILRIPPATARSRIRLALNWIKQHQDDGE